LGTTIVDACLSTDLLFSGKVGTGGRWRTIVELRKICEEACPFSCIYCLSASSTTEFMNLISVCQLYIKVFLSAISSVKSIQNYNKPI
jgi:hypothetical protein